MKEDELKRRIKELVGVFEIDVFLDYHAKSISAQDDKIKGLQSILKDLGNKNKRVVYTFFFNNFHGIDSYGSLPIENLSVFLERAVQLSPRINVLRSLKSSDYEYREF